MPRAVLATTASGYGPLRLKNRELPKVASIIPVLRAIKYGAYGTQPLIFVKLEHDRAAADKENPTAARFHPS